MTTESAKMDLLTAFTSLFTQRSLDEYLNVHKPLPHDVITKSTGKGCGIRTIGALRAAISEVTGLTLAVYYLAPPGAQNFPDEYIPFKGAATPKMEIVVAKIDATYNGKDFNYIIICRGDPDVKTDVMKLTEVLLNGTVYEPAGAWVGFNIKVPSSWEFGINTIAYLVTLHDFPTFIMDQTIPQLSKVLSGYLLMFPQVSTWMFKNCKVENYKPGMGAGGVRIIHGDASELIATGLSVLAPAFSRSSKFPEQLFRQLSTDSASGDYPSISKSQVFSFVKGCSWQVGNNSDLVCEVIGRALALDKQFNHDPNTFLKDLAPVDEVAKRFGLTKWAIHIFIQARIVFTKYQARSIQFGHAVMPVAEDIIVKLGGTWACEVARMKAIKDVLADAPYMCCQSFIPSSYKVANMPRVVYIGVLYHQANLFTNEEKEDFANFPIERIKKHINPKYDIEICNNIALILTPKPVIETGSLIEHASLSEAESLMSSKPPELASALYDYLQKQGSSCAWVKDQLSQRRAKYKKDLSQTLMRIVEETHDKTLQSMIADRESATTRAEFEMISEKINKFENSYQQEKAKLLSDPDLFHQSKKPRMQESRAQGMDPPGGESSKDEGKNDPPPAPEIPRDDAFASQPRDQ